LYSENLDRGRRGDTRRGVCLEKIQKDEIDLIQDAIQKASDAIHPIISDGMEKGHGKI